MSRTSTRLVDRARRSWFYVRHNVRDVYDSYLSRGSAPVDTPLGFRFGGLTSQHHRAMQSGRFEAGEVALLGRLFRSHDRFVDVGANVGYFTCLARSRGLPALAVEPMAINLRVLYENLAANGWDDTEVVPMALSDRVGTQLLYGASSTGASLIDNWAGAPSTFRRHISVTTLDNVLGGRFEGERLVVKIDVEGHEYAALRGATRLIERTPRPAWLIEITLNEFHPSASNPHFAATFDLFWKAGYACWRLEGERLAPVTRADVERWVARGTTDSPWLNYVFAEPGVVD